MKNTEVAERSVDITKARNELVAEIDDLWTQYQGSVEQVNRKYFHRMGDRFILLRKTFAKNQGGEREFAAFCRTQWPNISKDQRNNWTAYSKRLGRGSAPSALPPVEPPKVRARKKKWAGVKSTYRKIVDEEIGEQPEHFEIPRSAREVENELIAELAGKIINAGFRVLSVKMHPDKAGGSNEAQRRLNSAKTLLQDALTRQSLRI
jgi:hypothetical protein